MPQCPTPNAYCLMPNGAFALDGCVIARYGFAARPQKLECKKSVAGAV